MTYKPDFTGNAKADAVFGDAYRILNSIESRLEETRRKVEGARDTGKVIDFSKQSVVTGFTGTPTVDIKCVILDGCVCVCFNISGTSDATSFNFTIPFMNKFAVRLPCIDTGRWVVCDANSSVIDIYTGGSKTGWSGSGSKSASGQIIIFN